MVAIVRKLGEFEESIQRALSSAVGQTLRPDQQIVIQVFDVPQPDQTSAANGGLPSWCRVYDGLSDAQISQLESVIAERANLTRSAE